MIKRTVILILAASSYAFAQGAGAGGQVFIQSGGAATVSVAGVAPFAKGDAAVVGAPYSATITNESVQTLADGNHITQSFSGAIARDSQGRIRQDAPLPTIGNLAAANPPHIVFIRDPVAQVSYTLNLTDKTAQKMPALPSLALGAGHVSGAVPDGPGPVVIQMRDAGGPGGPPPGPTALFIQKSVDAAMSEVNVQQRVEAAMNGINDVQEKTESLGSETMQGVQVNGVRTTRTIPAGQIGNDAPIQIVTEVWSSPELQTIVYSKRSDPRMGEQTFQLTNIQRGEPDPSLFTVPADFKTLDGPQNFFYRTNP